MAFACVLDASAAVRKLMLTEVANTLWKLQRADQLAGLNPQ